MASEKVIESIRLIKSGDREQARKLLAAAIRENPKDEDAWYVMAAVVKDVDQRIDCLERVLELNPENKKANNNLKKLTKKEKVIDDPKNGKKQKSQKHKTLRNVILICIVIVISFMCLPSVISIFNNASDVPLLEQTDIKNNIPSKIDEQRGKYIEESIQISNKYIEAANDFKILNLEASENLSLLRNSEWILDITATLNLILDAVEDTKELNPPKEFGTVHTYQMEAAKHYTEFVRLYTKSMIDLDTSFLYQAMDEVEKANDANWEVVDELKKINMK